jgi:type I restriction enzyme M protein
LFPHGVLFRKEEAEMRQRLIQADLVECVLGLGPNLFYNSPMEACVVICRTRKPPERQGKVLLIDAVNEVTRERSISFLQSHHQDRIASAYHQFAEIPGFAHAASLPEIAAQGYSLSIPLYVRANGSRPVSAGEEVDGLRSAIQDWQQSSAQLGAALDNLLTHLESD